MTLLITVIVPFSSFTHYAVFIIYLFIALASYFV